jgi:two-component sensor histidine kinase
MPGGLGERLALLALLEAWLWALATPLVFWLASRYGPERVGWAAAIVLFSLCGLALAGLIDTIVDVLRVEVVGINPRRAGRFTAFRGIRRLWFLNDLIVYFAVLGAAFTRNYFLRYRERQAEAVALRAQLAESRLESLRMQLNPHFLFNTLNAISAQVERDPRGVRRMIARLSELLRATLESTSIQEVALRRELELLDLFLEIMKVRFQGALEIAVNVDPGSTAAMVPPLILQPLVENAAEHGIARISGPGRIEIGAKREGGRLILSVLDNGPGLIEGREGSTRLGLENTRERLRQLYGPQGRLTLETAPGGGALARIEIPYREAEEP